MSARAKELRGSRAELHAQAMKLVPDKGSMTPEVRAKFDAIMADVDALKGDIERVERAEALETELRSTQRPPEDAIGGAVGDEAGKADWKAKAERYNDAYWESMKCANFAGDQLSAKGVSLLSNGDRQILADGEYRLAASCSKYKEYRAKRSAVAGQSYEKRDMGIASPTASLPTSVLVPQGFVYDLEVALRYYGDMLNVATILETATGNPLPYPTENDTSQMGELIGEGAQVTGAIAGSAAGDVSVSNIILGAYKFDTKLVKISLELLQDSAFNLENFLKQAFAIRLGRVLNRYFTVGTGSGSSQPNGIMTAATASGQTVIGDDNQTTPDPTTQVGYEDLVNLEHSVDILYRRGSKWMFHDNTLRGIKLLKDKYGRPLWLPGIGSNAPDTILGYGYSINNDMASTVQSSPVSARESVAFGRLDKYLVRKVKELNVLRLVERFADYGQVAFLGFARYDGNLLDAGTNPVKYLTNPSH